MYENLLITYDLSAVRAAVAWRVKPDVDADVI